MQSIETMRVAGNAKEAKTGSLIAIFVQVEASESSGNQ
jgi:hypothetical protein